MRIRWFSPCLMILLATLLLAQGTPSPGAGATASATDCDSAADCAALAKRVVKQFGPDFKPVAEFKPLFGDLDGDGQEDAVVVATGNPMGGQGEFHYKVIDPYDAYFGWGGADVTGSFPQLQPGPRRNLLVVHGWNSDPPKAKFIIINLPFEHLSLHRITVKKKNVWVISAQETTSLVSSTYWDGRKYRWHPDYTTE